MESLGVQRLIVWAVRVLLVMVIAFIAGLPFYVFPPSGSAEGADLIYVIGPATQKRITLAEELRARGIASSILVSVVPEGQFPTARVLPICSTPDTMCSVPNPLKTRGEAAMLTDYGRTHSVHKTVIITFAPQVIRARFIFAKCYGGQVSVIYVGDKLQLQDWAYQYLYQTAGFVKAIFTPCPE